MGVPEVAWHLTVPVNALSLSIPFLSVIVLQPLTFCRHSERPNLQMASSEQDIASTVLRALLEMAALKSAAAAPILTTAAASKDVTVSLPALVPGSVSDNKRKAGN